MAEKPKIFTKIFHRTSKWTYRPPASGGVELKSITFDKDNLGLGEFFENNIEKVRKLDVILTYPGLDVSMVLTGNLEKHSGFLDEFYYVDCKIPANSYSNDSYGIRTTHITLFIQSNSQIHLYFFNENWDLAVGSSDNLTIQLENYLETDYSTLDNLFNVPADYFLSIKVYYE